ncbi:hypothetical protein ARMGADRAFT_1059255 [Armillaria gallica]|uniref:Uncharacterized protein n=1 Tax=Armillaria gallica TaxID=47427 RepID=A0A2H3EC70_ARMGA|nr:hypothetical protein ARMGADRAFT_1059255 [Armillaria gallica]
MCLDKRYKRFGGSQQGQVKDVDVSEGREMKGKSPDATSGHLVTSHTSEVSSERPYLTAAKPNQFGLESVRYCSTVLRTLVSFLLRDKYLRVGYYEPKSPISKVYAFCPNFAKWVILSEFRGALKQRTNSGCFRTIRTSCVIESVVSNIVKARLGGRIRQGEVVMEDIPISEQAEHDGNLEASVDTASLPSGSVCSDAVQPSRTSGSKTSVGVQCSLAPEESTVSMSIPHFWFTD